MSYQTSSNVGLVSFSTHKTVKRTYILDPGNNMRIINTVVIIILLNTCICAGSNLYKIKNIRNVKIPRVSECVNKIVHKSFPCGTIISVYHSNEDIDTMLSELSKYDCYSYVVRNYKVHNWLIPTTVNILTTSDASHFSRSMFELTSDIFWNPKPYFIVVLEKENFCDIEKIFDVLLFYNIFRVILIQRKSEENVTIYAYYPFNGANCGLKYEYTNISNCNDNNKIKYFSNETISLKNCNITVVVNQDIQNFIFDKDGLAEGVKEIPGLEQFLLDTIAEKEEIKFVYNLIPKDQSIGVVLANNSATGLFNILQKDEADIAAGGIILIKNRVDMFEYIWGYNYVSFSLFTPAVGEEIWKDVYKEFSFRTWMLIALTYCAITTICIIVQRQTSTTLHNHISLKLWGYLYYNTCAKLSKNVKMRRFMIFWIWFTFFICNFYNTALYSLLTNREQVNLHIRVDDLHTVPYEPCISETTQTYFQFALNKSLPNGRKIAECLYSDTALDYVASGNNAYAIELEYVYELRKQRYVDSEGRSKIDSWKFFTSNIIAIFFTRGFPRIEEFQDYAWRLYESGILSQNLKNLQHNYNKKLHKQKKHFKKIIIADLRIHFLILTLGYILSLLFFVFELVFYLFARPLISCNNI